MDLFASTARDQAIDVLHDATAIYTVETVVTTLLDQLDWPKAGRRLLDPGCGDGMFIGAALTRLLAAYPALSPTEAAALIQGWEVHPFAAGQARARLSRLLVAHGWENSTTIATAHRVIRHGDFLTEGPRTGETWHVIAGNPPYLRWANIPALLRDEYQRVTPDYAQADILAAFIDRCCTILPDDGEIGLITADRWLFNASSARLRCQVGQKVAIAQINRLDSASSFYRPKRRVQNTPPRVMPVALKLVAAKTPDAITLGAAPIYPDALSEAAGHPNGRVLGDIAQVRLAPMMDRVGCWILSDKQAAQFPREWLIPAIDTDDVAAGRLKEPTRFVFVDFDDPPQPVKDHIAARAPFLPPRLRQRKCAWLPSERWKSFDLSRPSLMVPRIARSLSVIDVPPGIQPVNHNLSIVQEADTDLEHVRGCLTSPAARAWIDARAPRLEGGFLSITTRFLRTLPVP